MKIQFRLPFDASCRSGLTTPARLLLATTAAFWMGTAQPQVGTTAVSRNATELRFRDLFGKADGHGGMQVSDTLLRVDGQPVRMVGYMVQQEHPVPGRFMLSPRPVQMRAYASDQVDGLAQATVVVLLDPSQQQRAMPHWPGLLAVRGLLQLGSTQEPDGKAPRVRLQLEPEAMPDIDAFDLGSYGHGMRRRM